MSIVHAHRWKVQTSAVVENAGLVTTVQGIAYAWSEWILEKHDSDGKKSKPLVCAAGGQCREWVNVQDIQQAVNEQASKIRAMKEGPQGLTNQDSQVQQAVAELLRLKDLLAEHASSSLSS